MSERIREELRTWPTEALEALHDMSEEERAAMAARVLRKIQAADAVWMSDEVGDEAGDGARRVGSQCHRAIVRDARGLIAETIVEVYDAEAHPRGLIRRVVERADDGSIEDITEYHLPWTPRENR